MKKLLAATLLTTALVGVNVAGAQAATCPNTNTQYKVVTYSGSQTLSQDQLNQLISQYFGNSVNFANWNTKAAVPVQQTPQKQYTAPTQAAPVQVAPAQKAAPQPAQQAGGSKGQATAGLTQEEQQMLNLVNQERQKNGLAPLKANMQLVKMARVKAKDMIDNNYFSHQSPTYGSPFDMMKTFGISYQTAGENIAGNQTVSAAHTALMNSAGHRANILNGSFTQVGIGIVNGGPYGKMFVQDFIG
ncbi:CAP domain-containing protein [Aneurinibacillus sp. Ricciae_BoGa-3]|uniref:CAP domain-containing protein n=1 Tax=Aneurinibacillus sp. Ricciae_BoGa-3 TaxID=3022697 RepID=UPI0023424BFB|nr:CAP domain-containing protein [Aneurinibacillus sp. Ricciae_BoGa-3]WCK52388.1 CAP domain-containing protein [Aneurinibacillus sp. Ricciae_BoGa-3]